MSVADPAHFRCALRRAAIIAAERNAVWRVTRLRIVPRLQKPTFGLGAVQRFIRSSVSSFSFESAAAPSGTVATTAVRAPEIGDRELFHRMTTRASGSVSFV